MCDEAEARLEELGCRDSLGDPIWVNKNGERYAETCRVVQEEGMIFLNPRCIASALNCTEANECPVKPH